MAKLNKGPAAPTVAALMNVADSVSAQQAIELSNENVLGNIVGTKVDNEAYIARESALEGVVSQVGSKMSGSEDGLLANESFSAAQNEAGAIVLAAGANPDGYATVALSTEYGAASEGATDMVNTVGIHGATGGESAAVLSNEYFNDAHLAKHLGASFAFNTKTARQVKWAEQVMPTITLDPSEMGVELEIKRSIVHDEVRHAIRDKDSRGYNERNLLDAAVDAETLTDDSIAFVPYLLEDGENADNFVGDSLVPAADRKVSSYTIHTAPLTFAKSNKNLLQLSDHPGLVKGGILDETDALAPRISLEQLYFTVQKEGSATTQVVKVKTTGMAQSTFDFAPEGDRQEMLLNFQNAVFVLSAGSTDIAGNPISAIDELISDGKELKFTVTIRSSINLTTGNEEAIAGGIRIVEVSDTEGNSYEFGTGALKAIVDKINLAAVGYDYKAARSTANYRVSGRKLGYRVSRERAKVHLGSPLSVTLPVNTKDTSAAVETLIEGARLQNAGNATSKVLDYTDTLKAVKAALPVDPTKYTVPSIEGIARHHVRVWYDEFEVNLPESVSSPDNLAVDDNLAASIQGTLREQVARALMESRYQVALEAWSNYSRSFPEVVIVCDPLIANYLERKDQMNFLGSKISHSIEVNYDSRWVGRIQWFFRVPEGAGQKLCPLNAGNFFYIPEMVTEIDKSENNRVAKLLTVQPRGEHYMHVPVTGVLNVLGVKELVRGMPIQGIAVQGDLSGAAGDEVIVDPVVAP